MATLKETVDAFAKTFFHCSRTEAHEQNVCVFCGSKVGFKDFRDTLSRKEYGISALCQECQDKTFGTEEE